MVAKVRVASSMGSSSASSVHGIKVLIRIELIRRSPGIIIINVVVVVHEPSPAESTTPAERRPIATSSPTTTAATTLKSALVSVVEFIGIVLLLLLQVPLARRLRVVSLPGLIIWWGRGG